MQITPLFPNAVTETSFNCCLFRVTRIQTTLECSNHLEVVQDDTLPHAKLIINKCIHVITDFYSLRHEPRNNSRRINFATLEMISFPRE